MKKFAVIFLGLTLLMAAMPAHADSKWSAWLFSSVSNQLVRVYEDGTRESYTLPLANNTIASQIAIAPNESNRVAFCSMDYTSNVETPPQILQVIDLNSSAILMSHTFEGEAGCTVTRDSFSPDGTRLAVGTASELPGNQWQLLVFDIASGNWVTELTADSPAILGLMDSMDLSMFSVIPWVELFEESRIVFSLYPYRTDAPPMSTAFEWVYADNVVNSVTGFGGTSADYLPNTGEIVWVEHDPALASTEPGGPMPRFNVVKYKDSSGGIKNIYHNAENLPVKTVFINDGQTVAIQLMSPLEMSIMPPEPPIMSWVALDRYGNLTPLQDGVTGSTEIMPARGGYVYFINRILPGTNPVNTYALEYHTPDGVEVLWEVSDEDAWQVVEYTVDPVDPTQLDPFQAINN